LVAEISVNTTSIQSEGANADPAQVIANAFTERGCYTYSAVCGERTANTKHSERYIFAARLQTRVDCEER